MDHQLKKIIEKIIDKTLREKVEAFLENPEMELDGKIYKGLPLETAPAGVSRHHNYPGGFVQHAVSVTNIALGLCKVIRKVYGGKVNKDLVIAGAILHDIFKPLTYIERENGTYGMSPLAERLDHVTLGVAELVQRGFSLDLVHIICAHMGWQNGPIGPRTTEALVVHLADMTDSRLNGEVLRAAQHLLRDSTGVQLSRLTATEAFEIVNTKTVLGWGGVPKALEKIRKQRQKASWNR